MGIRYLRYCLDDNDGFLDTSTCDFFAMGGVADWRFHDLKIPREIHGAASINEGLHINLVHVSSCWNYVQLGKAEAQRGHYRMEVADAA